MPKQEGGDLLQTLMSAFHDSDLGMSRYRSFPYVQDETALSHLYRIMEFWNVEIWDDTSTKAISKEVILTLLQCAARLYEDKMHVKAAVNLIESTHTRAILSLAIQDVLCRIANQHYRENIRSDKSEEKTADTHKRRADLFSSIRKTKARQLNYEAMIFEHISSLCQSHGSALQNTFDIPKADEGFMFHNYVTLSKAFNGYEKSWLATLLPGIFKWEDQDSGDGGNGDRFLAPNLGAVNGAKQDAPSTASKVGLSPLPATTPNIRGVNVSWNEHSSLESVASRHWSLPRAPLLLNQASTTEWKNGLRRVCLESETGASDEDFEPFALTKKVLEFEKWISLLRKRATKKPRSYSAMTVTSPLHEAIEFYDQSTSQKEVRRPIGIRIERKDASNYNAERKDSRLSPSSDSTDSDWDLPESGHDSESIFRFSPDDYNNSSNGKLPSSASNADGEHKVCMFPPEGAHEAFRTVSSLSLQSTNKRYTRAVGSVGAWRGDERRPE